MSESLKEIGLVSEGLESITYNFTEIIKNTFVETPTWLSSKKCTINPQNNDDKRFQYSVTLSLYHKQIKPDVNNLNWNNINFHQKNKIIKH